MAKEAVSPIERHIEKGVLVLTVLLFVGVVVKYLVSSPNTVMVGADEVGPKQIYDKVADEGRALRERIRRYSIPVEMPAKPKLSGPEIKVAMLPSPVPFGPCVPKLKTEETGNIELVSVLAPSEPKILVGRSGMVLAPSMAVTAMPDDPLEGYYKHWNEIRQQDEPYVIAVNWVTVATTFDVDAQRRRANENGYPPGRAVPYLAGVEIERREKNWDGSYSEWEKIKPYAPLVLPEVPQPKIEEIDGKELIPDDERQKIIKFAQTIRNTDYRLELMRPMPPPVAYGDYWLTENLELGGFDPLKLDDEVWYGEDEGSCPLWDRYPKKPKERKPVKDMTSKEKERFVDGLLDNVEAWIKQGCYETAVDYLDRMKRDTEHLTDKQKTRRAEMLDRASRLLDKKTREKKDREKRGEPEPLRELSPIQVLWAHDTLNESVVSGKTYQYRMRALLYNNFAGAAGELNNPRDAEIVLLAGEWSPSSNDVSIPYDTEFFLVGKKERNLSGKADVFKWHEGAWVKSSFHVTVGSPIGGKDFVKIGSKAPGDSGKVRIDFSTGATVVDLNFNRPFRRRKERHGVVTLDDPKPTLAMVYLDSAGELHERLLDADKRSKAYKEMKDKVETGHPNRH